MGCAVEDFDFCVAFPEVDGCDYAFDALWVGLGADPDVDSVAVATGCADEFTVVERVNDVGVFRVAGALGSIDVDVAFGD